MRIGSIVINCRDVGRLSAFWGAALGYEPRDPPTPGWAVMRDPNKPNVNLSFNQVPYPHPGKPWLHLDLYTEVPEAEIARLLALGATRHPRASEPDEDFVVLADPEGNLFCVVDTRR